MGNRTGTGHIPLIMWKNYLGLIFLGVSTLVLALIVPILPWALPMNLALVLVAHAFFVMVSFLAGVRMILWFEKRPFSLFDTWYHHSYALYSFPLLIMASRSADVLLLSPLTQVGLGVVMLIRLLALYHSSASRARFRHEADTKLPKPEVLLQFMLLAYCIALISLSQMGLHNYAVTNWFTIFFWCVAFFFTVYMRAGQRQTILSWIGYSLLWLFYAAITYYVTLRGLPIAGDFHSFLPVFFLAEVLYLCPVTSDHTNSG